MVVLLMALTGCSKNPNVANPQSTSSNDSSSAWSFPENAEWNYNIDTEDNIKTSSVKIDTFFSSGISSYFSARAHLPLSRPNAMFSSAATNKISPIECARKKENGDNYVVYNIEEGGKYFCFFPADQGYYLSHSIWAAKPLKAKDFEHLQVWNSKFTEVIATDPAIMYSYDKGYNSNIIIVRDKEFVYRFSLHLLEEGLLVIRYNNFGVQEENQESISLDTPIIDIQLYEDFKFPLSLGTAADGVYDYSILAQDAIR